VDAVLELLTPCRQLRTPASDTEKSDSSPELGALPEQNEPQPSRQQRVRFIKELGLMEEVSVPQKMPSGKKRKKE
jgi:hypothetical protein